MIRRSWIAWLLLLSGLANLLEATIPKTQAVADWMEQWVPLEVSQGSRLLIFLFGLIQVVISRGLFRGKKSAWWIAIIALGATVVLHLGHAWDWHHAVWSLVLLLVLLWRKNDFVASSDAASSRWGLFIGGWAMVAMFLYSYSTVWHYAPQAHLKRDPLLITRASVGLVLFQNLAAEGLHSKRAHRSFEGVQLGSLVLLFCTLLLVLRPVLGGRIQGSEEEQRRVEKLIVRYGRDPMDGFALMADKRRFFMTSPEGADSVVSYGLWRNVAVALAEPIGPQEERKRVMAGFRAFCLQQDWRPAFYCCHEINKSAWQGEGWHALHIAEDARLLLATFELKGSAFQSLRTNLHHAHKQGWSYRWYEGAPLDHGLEAQMKLLSDSWLKAKGGAEMGFDLGAFSIPEIRSLGGACVLDGEGQLLAFATWLPYAQGSGRVIDLMRTAEGVRGAMDFLILESAAYFKSLGIVELSLGNAPLAHVKELGEKPAPSDWVIAYLFEHFNQVYGYKPLFEFKKKYHPEWQGRYLLFAHHADLPSLAAALVRLHAPQGVIRMLLS